MIRHLTCLAALLLAAACAAPQNNADETTIRSVRYTDPGAPSLTLYTMVNNRTGSGGHSSLLISASERVIFDPAGSFEVDIVPERDDVLFGITPAVEAAYRSSHARSTFHVVSQKIPVTAQHAEMAYQLALKSGPVPGAFCANATSGLLKSLPGFESIQTTYYPTNLQDQVAQIPGVVTDKYYEGDSADLQAGIALNNAKLSQQE